MPVALADMFISVSADVSAAVAGLTSLENRLNSTANQFRAAAPAALLLEGAAVGVGGGLLGAVKVAATFEQQMSAIKSVMSTSEVDQFGGAIADLALKLGRDTVFTSREAAAGIEALIKAGIPVADVLNGGAEAATLLAAATGTSVVQAATVAAQVLNTFRVSGDKAGDAVNILAKTANASASDVNFLSLGLAQSGGVASGLGVSYGEAIQTLGLLSRSFISGSDAGTSYKTFLLSLTPSTDKQIEAFKRLGLITADNRNQFFNANGTIKTTAEVAGVLQRALGGLTDEQRSAAEQTLFGTDAIRAAEAFYRSGAEGVRQFQDQVAAAKSVQEQATERLNNLLGALQNLGGSLETVGILVGTLFLPGLKALADSTRGIVDQFSRLSPEAQRAIVTFTGITGAVLGIVGGAVLLVPLFGAMGASFAALAGIMAAAAPGFVLLGAVSGALLLAFRSNFAGLRDFVTSTFDRFGPILGNFAVVFQKAFTGDIRGALDTFRAIIGAISPNLGAVLDNVRTAVSGFFDTFGPVLSNFGLVLQKVFAGDLGGALDTFRAIIGALVPSVTPLVAALGDLAGVVGGTLALAFQSLRTVLDVVVPPLVTWANTLLGSFNGAALARSALDLMTTAVRSLSTGIQEATLFVQTHTAQIGLLASVTGGAVLAFIGIQAVLGLWAAAMEIARLATVAFTVAQVALDLALTANPIGIIIVALGALAGGLAFLFATNEDFRNSVLGLWDALGNLAGALGAVAGPVGEGFNTFLSAAGALLGPLATAAGNFFGALGNLIGALVSLGTTAGQGLFENVLVPGFQALLTVLQPLLPVLQPLLELVFAPMLLTLQAMGTAVQQLTQFFEAAALAIQNVADTIGKIVLPPWLTPGSGAGPFGAPAAGGASVQPAAFTFGTGGGGGGNVFITGPVTIGSEVDAQKFLADMAALVKGSAGRVTQPPDNSGFPTLVGGVV